MTDMVAALQAEIAEAVGELLLPRLFERAAREHRQRWRECSCEWCALKRTATVRISNLRCADPERRADLRFQLATEYRVRLRRAFTA